MVEMIRVNAESEVVELSRLATEIVREHFDKIIDKAQNDYMLERFQTVEAISGQIREGYRYYWVVLDGRKVGFVGFFPKNGMMYLSKFYVHKDFRGNHLAQRMISFIVSETRAEGLSRVYLNVNRNNTDVIQIYEHLGFRIVREECNDIGGGFFMDDYVLELEC